MLKDMKKTIYISLALILLVVIAAVVILNYQSKTPSGIIDKSCSSNDDCVIVAPLDPSNPCCETCSAEAISKQAEIKRSEWHAKNCEGIECPYYDCYSEKLPKPRCINNQCEIQWVERPK